MIEKWNGVGFLVKLDKPKENGDRHFSAQGEGDLYAGGILSTKEERMEIGAWFVCLSCGSAHGTTFASALDGALRDAERNYKSAQRFWEVSRELEAEQMQGDE